MGNGALEEWRIRYITCTTLTYISAKIGRAGGKAKNAKTGAPGGAGELGAKLGQSGGGYYPTMDHAARWTRTPATTHVS